MAKTRRDETAAPDSVQETQEAQDMAQDTQAQEAVSDRAHGGAETAQGTSFGSAERPSRQPSAAYAVAGCDALNLREKPSLDARIVAVLPRGAGVFGPAGPAENGWRQVFTGRLTGWVMARYLEPVWI